MIYGIGIDILEIERLRKALSCFKAYFQKRVFHPKEIDNCENRKKTYSYYTIMFTSKEAFLKALGVGWQEGLKLTDIEIECVYPFKPRIMLHGKTKMLIEQLKIKKMLVDFAYTNNYAVSLVILEV